jgi:hypothetical protein
MSKVLGKVSFGNNEIEITDSDTYALAKSLLEYIGRWIDAELQKQA